MSKKLLLSLSKDLLQWMSKQTAAGMNVHEIAAAMNVQKNAAAVNVQRIKLRWMPKRLLAAAVNIREIAAAMNVQIFAAAMNVQRLSDAMIVKGIAAAINSKKLLLRWMSKGFSKWLVRCLNSHAQAMCCSVYPKELRLRGITQCLSFVFPL